MSTRSMIAKRDNDGRIQAVYCHGDGYPSHNGRILFEHYQDTEKIDELIKHGSLSVLGANIGTRWAWNDYINRTIEQRYNEFEKRNQCIFYHRDRNDSVSYCRAKQYQNTETFLQQSNHVNFCYIFDMPTNNWHMVEKRRDYPDTEEALVDVLSAPNVDSR